MLRGSQSGLRASSTRAIARLTPRRHASHSARPLKTQGRSSNATQVRITLGAAVALTAGVIWYTTTNIRIHNDASSEGITQKTSPTSRGAAKVDDTVLQTFVWGTNKTHILAPDGQMGESFHLPADAEWLHNVALRDLALAEKHAACIDARGDVYQWGDAFFQCPPEKQPKQPVLTLRGKNIVKLQVTPTRVFALSASGRIYVLAACRDHQALAMGVPTPSSTPWWGTGWMWGEEEDIDFAEITPNEKLARKEKFVAISAGNNHLLALTSSGRTFVHPIDLRANTYGQLGLRKFDIPDNSVARPHARKEIELTPKSHLDPYAKATPAIRKGPEPSSSEAQLDDSGIRFSDKLFEIPALRGIEADKIAAGGRSSFVKTASGRVLGWGANEFGQIGLGGNVTLETITVPTEVILWRSTPQGMRTSCLDVYAGGDLTFFKVERVDGTAMPYVDILSCGNGQWGGLGNAQYTNAQGTPVKAKNVSGLYEYSETTNNLQPIHAHDISISPTGHILLTLDTLTHSGPGSTGGGGRDLVTWGANSEYQLGNGKRGSLPIPTVLEWPGEDGRFILRKRDAAEVKDLGGRIWKKGVKVEQCVVAGYGNSVVYWKICS